MPELAATFEPQQWINDHAVNCDDDIHFDAAAPLLSLSDEAAIFCIDQIKREGRDLDAIAFSANLAGDNGHKGPFTVFIDRNDFENFLDKLGLSIGDEPNNAWMAELRASYAASLTSAPRM